MRTLVSMVLSVACLVPTLAWAQPIFRIGELSALVGPIAPYGTQLHNGRLLAVDEINAAGGITIGGARHRLQLVHLDGGTPGEAIKVFERLLSVEKVNIVLDGAFSSVQYAMGPVLKGKNVAVIWSGGTDPATTVGVPNAFRNHFDGGLPAMRVHERFLKKMGVRRVATYGQTGHSEFKAFVETFLPKIPGLEVVATEWHPFGEKDFFPVLTKLKALRPDAVITHGVLTDSVTLLKQAREIGLFPGPLWLNQSGNAPLMIDADSRQVMEGSYESLQSSLAATTEPTAKGRALYQAYAKRFGERGFGSQVEPGYDSLYIAARAVERAGSTADVQKIIAAMRSLTTADIPELLLPYKPGPIFDKDGQAYPKISITQWKDGKHVQVFADYGD